MNTVIDFIMYKLYPLWMFGFNCSVTHVNQLPMYSMQFKLPIGYGLANRNLMPRYSTVMTSLFVELLFLPLMLEIFILPLKVGIFYFYRLFRSMWSLPYLMRCKRVASNHKGIQRYDTHLKTAGLYE